VDVAEDVGVAEGMGDVGVVESTLGCLAEVGVAVGEPSSGYVAVADVGVEDLSLRSVAVGPPAVEVGVALDDHFLRSTNGRPTSRQNERVGISLGDNNGRPISKQNERMEISGCEPLGQIPPRPPIASSVEIQAPLGSTWRSIDSWTLSNAPIARHAFGRKSESRVTRRTRFLRCARHLS
jgi:hypothetical protein